MRIPTLVLKYRTYFLAAVAIPIVFFVGSMVDALSRDGARDSTLGVTIELATSGERSTNFRVTRVPLFSHPQTVQGDGKRWRIDASFLRRIRIDASEEDLSRLTGLTVTIGEAPHAYTREAFLRDWSRTNAEGKRYFESPSSLRQHRSFLPVFGQILNYKGQSDAALAALRDAGALFFGLLLLFPLVWFLSVREHRLGAIAARLMEPPERASTRHRWVTALGFFLVALYLAPLLILNRDAHIPIGDYLEQTPPLFELLARSGKTFAPNHEILPQVIHGIERKLLPSEIDFFYLLNWLFGLLPAILISQLLLRLVAFWGMLRLLSDHLFARETDIPYRHLLSVGVAVCFAVMPFHFATYLTIAGIPWLWSAFLALAKRRARALDVAFILFYPLFSMLHLGSFAVIASVVALFAFDAWRRRRVNWKFAALLAALIALTVVKEYRLFAMVLFEPGFVSQRAAMEFDHNLLSALTFARELLMTNSLSFFKTMHLPLIAGALALAGLFLLARPERAPRRLLLLILGILAIVAIRSFTYWDRLNLLHVLPVLKTLNISRVIALLPVLWCLVFAESLGVIAARNRNLILLCLSLILAQIGFLIAAQEEVVNRNELSFRQFFSQELFAEIKGYIGKDPKDYRIVNVGIQPTITLYNGFYNVDAYLAVYPMAYKERFMRIMEKEIAKSRDVRYIYEKNGYHVQIFPAENPFLLYDFGKKRIPPIERLEVHAGMLRDMKVQYALSAAEIKNHSELRWHLLKVFEGRGSPYRVYLYGCLPPPLPDS
ncbi:MAG: hypothetical protein J0L75_15345 [Spirochaetes bacterium]|nr:hypothetical protein [Spirochaetota bacterium]